MSDAIVEDILGRPDAAEVVAELRRRVVAREHAGLPLAARLAEAERSPARAARLTRKAVQLFPNDPLGSHVEVLHGEIRRVLSDVQARLKAAGGSPHI